MAERPKTEEQPAADAVDNVPTAHPQDVVEPEDALAQITMEELPTSLREAAARAGWSDLMPVQRKAIPYLLKGRDLMVQSRTGSGKTGAFLMPMLEQLDPAHKRCQALVLAPTRELAKQVASEAEILFGDTGLSAVTVYGGVAYGPQIEAFERGVPLVVGTPGRVLDHLLKGNLNIDALRVLVLDEADRMLSMGFYPDMDRINQFVPKTDRSGFMFSATFTSAVRSLAREFLHEPDFLSLSRDRVHVAETEHVVYTAPPMRRHRSLMRIIEVENPTAAIIFCNTKDDVRFVSQVLKNFGYDAEEMSSDLAQNAREKVLGRLREAKLRFLVATDVAARGIDIVDLSHVFQYGPPQDHEGYIHRVGRTGRAGATGKAVTLVSPLEKMDIKHIAKRYGIDLIELEVPDEEEVAEVVAERVTAALEARLRDRPKLRRERMKRFLPLARSLGESEDEVAIVAMLLDDYYQETLHAPPEMPTGEADSTGDSDDPGDRRPDRDGRKGRKQGRSKGRRRR